MDGDATCQLLAINEYTGQQATLTECRAACDCYLDDLQYHMASFDQGVFEQIWLRLCAKESSAIELAFLQAMIAVTGCVAPSNRSIAKVDAISGDRGHQSRLKTTLLHLKSCPSQQWNGSILMINTLHLISFYYFLTKQFENAWKYSQGCIRASESKNVGLFEEKAEGGGTLCVQEQRAFCIRQRLEHDIYTLDGYLAFQLNRPALLEKKPPLSTRMRRWESATLDDAPEWSDIKLQGANLSLQVASCLRQGSKSHQDLTQDISSLERDISAFLYASLRGAEYIRSVKRSEKTYDSSDLEVKISFSVHIATMLCYTLRCMLLQSFNTLDRSPQLLQSANSIIKSLPLCFSLLNSPLQRIQTTTSTFTFVNVAMSSFSQVLEQASTSSSLEHHPCQNEIQSFRENLDQTYMLLNWMGAVGPYTMRCAEMIKDLPIPRSDGDPLLAALYENMRRGRPLFDIKLLQG